MIYALIKAKSGLHAGASWRLDQGHIVLGSCSRSDVFLCDPDIPETLISLRRMGRRFRIDNLHNEARLNAEDQAKIEEVLFPSQVVNLDFRHIQLEIQILNSTYNFAHTFGDRISRLSFGFLQLLRQVGAKAICVALLFIGLLMTAGVLFFGTAGIAKSQASTIAKPTALPAAKWQTPKAQSMEQQMVTNAQQDIQDFAQRAQVKRLDMQVTDNQLSIDAVLSRSQHSEFERELQRLAQNYGDKIDIVAQARMTDEQATVDTLDIESVVLGSRPVIVLRDGARLYVGGKYQGLTVLAIDAKKVRLESNSTAYEVLL